LGLAICRRISRSRLSTSVWTGFVFGFSHPTSTAGSGSQKADEIAEEFMASSLVVDRSWSEQLGSMTFRQLTKETRWRGFRKKRAEDKSVLVMPRKLSRLDAHLRVLVLNKLA
jgi:hypothetical protein